MDSSARELQAAYYDRTASSYDAMHNNCEDHEHTVALRYIDMMSGLFGLHSFLDVGAGTGRALLFLQDRGKLARGVEPIEAMIRKAEENGVPREAILQGSGYELPFPDGSFDAVLECGVLHHVEEPSRMVAEMMRVAKTAVFLSDSNRFGQGRPAVRLLKLALFKMGLWRACRFVQTKGKMYTFSEGDGLAYSYSVFDSYHQLARGSKRIWLIPTGQEQLTLRSWADPLLTSSHVLLCAFKRSSPANSPAQDR